ncbi:MAG: hypothetical protein M0Q38_11340 [Bacteroidales bacterium]|jgi:hypothetical protein|nr:hypothetical protein [Bacteroidales bacterium]
MKKLIRLLLITGFLFIMPMLANQTFADNPPPPPSGHGTSGNQAPSGVPIDGGLGILFVLGAAYGGYKMYKAKKKSDDSDP